MSGRGGRTVNLRTVQIVIFSGVGVATLLYMFKRFFRRQVHAASIEKSNGVPAVLQLSENRPESTMSYARHTPSERGCVAQAGSERVSRVRHTTLTSTVPPLEADLVVGLETCQELTRNLERSFTNLELVRNRSDKDRNRAEMVQSILDRLKILETDIHRLVIEGGSAPCGDDIGSALGNAHYYTAPHAGTLSVLSDDSFMSALEDLPRFIEEDVGEDLDIERSKLLLFETGLEKAMAGEVFYRKPRTELTQCESETEFAAKVYCLREAFQMGLRDEHRRLWLAKCGRQLLGDIMKLSKQDPRPFYNAFDDMMDFCAKEQNQDMISIELASRGVVVVSFWDVLLDFMLLDGFDDLKAPPSAIFSVTRNYFLSESLKYATISTIVWSMLKKKRQRLMYAEGFIAHFYNISETVSPAITLGFLGTDEQIREICLYFKDQIQAFVLDIFNLRRARYTTIEDLAEDVWVQLQQRTELVLTRLSSELIPI